MAQTEIRFELNQNHRAYDVSVNDGGFDGGFNCVATINVSNIGEILPEHLEAAVQAFASSLSNATSEYSLQYVRRITVTETTL